MRFIKPDPKHGDFRVKTGFLFFPKTIDGETRWLERAAWLQKYQVSLIRGIYTYSENSYWEDRMWVSDEYIQLT